MITSTVAPHSGLGQRAPQPKHFVSPPQATAATGVLRHTVSTTLWRTVPGYPAYEVSVDGVVRRCQGFRCHRAHRVLMPFIRPNGYAQILLYQGGQRQRFGVHQLVALAFLGPKPSLQHQVAHLDGQRLNNHVSNLAWLLPIENDAHKDLHGTRLRGSQIHSAKLVEAQVVLIRQALAVGIRQCVLAQTYGVSDSTVSLIARAKTWRHVR
ncbi:HNH endonuclease [Yanghanlia caeni]|uniref:HNH endonuclease n=1 Tax=Yanghanlia caeni TaxID=3064283 RepID=A0ABU1D525_9BURK|nr:HNH endonuclease [Alcaligenaceae bacterium LG-2]